MRFQIKPVAMAGIVVVCLVLAAGAFYVYFSFNARWIFNTQISALTRRHVEARVVRAEFPARIVVEGLSIDGLLTCDRATVSVDVLSLLSRDIRFRTIELLRPVLTWEQMITVQEPDAVPSFGAAQMKGLSNKNVILAQLVIHDGVLKVVTRNNEGLLRSYVVDHVQLRAHNVPLTDTPARTDLFMTGSLIKLDVPFVGHLLKVNGWLNWAAKDMDASVQVMDDSGRIGVDAKIASRQNDMVVFGDVTLAGSQEPQAEGKKSGMVENVVLNMMMATDTDMDMGFSFKTKMDRIDIGTVSLSGRITTGLNSSVTSGNIVAGLKAASEELLKASEDVGTQK
jgi:hypothetical protein